MTDIVKKAKDRFNKDLLASNYSQIHHDDDQLKILMSLIELKDDKNYLDVGTGNGYVAFEMARKNLKSKIVGIDIADKAINENNERQSRERIINIEFKSFNGIDIPFNENYFSGIVTRYAFHHFPDADLFLSQARGILKENGYFVFSDPVKNVNDKNDFVNSFMKLKDDGHVKLYEESEIVNIFKNYGFYSTKSIKSSIRFPREYNEHYIELLDKTSADIKKLYNIEINNDKVYITLDVVNIKFENN